MFVESVQFCGVSVFPPHRIVGLWGLVCTFCGIPVFWVRILGSVFGGLYLASRILDCMFLGVFWDSRILVDSRGILYISSIWGRNL